MVLRLVFALFTVCLSGVAVARPLITSSEDTLQSVCLENDRPWQELVEICNAALKDRRLVNSDRIRLLDVLGNAQRELSDYAEAEKSYQQILTLAPENASAFSGLGWLEYDRDNYTAAKEHFQRAVDIWPSAGGLGGLGGATYRHDRTQAASAMEMLDMAIAVDPDYAWAFSEKGWVQKSEGDLEASIASFKQAVEINPNYGFALYWLAVNHRKLDRLEEALDFANRSNDAGYGYWALVERSRILLAMGRRVQAMRDATLAIETDPAREAAYVSKAKALNDMGLIGVALTVYRDMPDEVERSDYSYYWEADLLLEDGDVEAADRVIDKAIALNAEDNDNWSLKAYIAVESDRFSTALDAALKASMLDETDAWARLYQAVALVHLDKKEEALEQFGRAVEMGISDGNKSWFIAHLVEEGFSDDARALRDR